MTAHLIVHPKHAKWMNLENEVKLLKTYPGFNAFEPVSQLC